MASIMSSGYVVNGCAVNGCAVNYADDAAYIEDLEALDDIVSYALYDAEFDLTEDSIRFLDKKKKKGVEKKKKSPVTNEEKDMNQLVKKFKKRLIEEKKRMDSMYLRNKHLEKQTDKIKYVNEDVDDIVLEKDSYLERMEREDNELDWDEVYYRSIDIMC